MGRHKVKGIPYLCIDDNYGDIDVYTGGFNPYNGKREIWIQAGDDLEGNPNGNPAANITITASEIKLETGEKVFNKIWKVPIYKDELKSVQAELDTQLREYFSQFEQQDMFKRKE